MTDITATPAPHPVGVVPASETQSSLGYLVAMLRNPLRTLPASAYERPWLRRTIFGVKVVYVMDPALLRELMVDRADAVVKTDMTAAILRHVMGDSIFSSEGALWRWQRRTAAPLFRHDRLLGFLPTMIAAAERMRDRWLAGPGQALKMNEAMNEATYDIIVETMMSGRDDIDSSSVGQAVADYLSSTAWRFAWYLIGAPRWTPFPGRKRAERASAYIRRSIEDVVVRRRAAPPREDLISQLLAASDPETGRTMTDSEITDNLIAFAGAGHETTAAALTWAFYLISARPDVEAQLLAEIETVTGGGDVLPEHIDRLVYVRQVFQEAMRLYPPVPIFDRRITKEVVLGDLRLEPNTIVVIPAYAIHRHKAIWTSPDSFDPDRFRPEAAKALPRGAYLPFGIGPRTCIGMGFAMLEGVAILAILLKAVRVTLEHGHNPRPRVKISLRSHGGMPMTVTPRAPGAVTPEAAPR